MDDGRGTLKQGFVRLLCKAPQGSSRVRLDCGACARHAPRGCKHVTSRPAAGDHRTASRLPFAQHMPRGNTYFGCSSQSFVISLKPNPPTLLELLVLINFGFLIILFGLSSRPVIMLCIYAAKCLRYWACASVHFVVLLLLCSILAVSFVCTLPVPWYRTLWVLVDGMLLCLMFAYMFLPSSLLVSWALCL